MSTHQPQPLIWLARSDTSSRVLLGSGDCSITRFTLAKRLPILAPSLVGDQVDTGVMITSPFVLGGAHGGAAPDHEMPGRRPL